MTQLVRYEAARYALQEARSIDEVKDVKDKSEALRLYARQANDRDMELWTAEIKVRAVRRIGELSSALETAQGFASIHADGGKNGTKTAALESAGISTSAAHRYEQIAAIPEPEFEARIADAKDAQEPVSVSGMLKPHVANNSGNNEWYTPPDIIEAAREVMGGIDLDPASSAVANRTVQAARYFTAQTDGLKQHWSGAVWLNPPYAHPLIAQFCEKLESEVVRGAVEQACLLVNNATETAWFQRIGALASAVCFLRGRIKYLDETGVPAGTPLQGQAILYFGERADVFTGRFSASGLVLLP